MEDSFFGFDTSAPLEDDGGSLEEAPEDVYDALNDETFGSAIKGDWEKSHEHLVKLDGHVVVNGNKKIQNSFLLDDDDDDDDDEDDESSDLEISLSRVRLDDVDIGTDDNECRIQLDPSVWANPLKSSSTTTTSTIPSHPYSNPEAFLRQHFSNPFEVIQNQQHAQQQHNQQQQEIHRQQQQQQQQQHHHQQQQLQQQQQQNLIQFTNMQESQKPFFGMPGHSMNPPKICTVEDIERNIRNQQQRQQQQLLVRALTPKPKATQSNHQPLQPINPQQRTPNLVQPVQPHPQTNGNFYNRSVAPPGFNNGPPRGTFPIPPQQQHPMNHMMPGSAPPGLVPVVPHRMPPGFPALPIIPGNVGGGSPHPHANFPRPMPNLPIALNNFAMHPNFNAMRPIGPPIVQQRMPPHPGILNHNMMPPPCMVAGANLVGNPMNVTEYNQRIMQEIQQNHPMLANNRIPIFNQLNMQQMQNNHQSHNNRQQLDKSGMPINKQNLRSNGNLPDEYDAYANLMSTRDKHWLIGIQLSQLNTDTPYIDDYYYTANKERKAKLNGESGQSKAHKDNQLNHPFSQPKGHAQLVLISMGNKNGTQNHHHHRNGQQQHHRERKNSETLSIKEKEHQMQQQRQYTNTPLQFENSLGKLQYGSVTAPRKIIDMDLLGSESSTQLNTSLEISAQRKSRHILLHIETVYRLILKFEDLENPAAIASSIIFKEKKQKLLWEQMLVNASNKSDQSIDGKTESASTSLNSSISEKYSAYELESKDKLLAKLLPCLTLDKIIGMMGVRKGKTLMRRILPHIDDHPIRWTVWLGVFSSLQNVLKKDKDDKQGVLYNLYPLLKKQIKEADINIVIKFANAMPLNEKKLNVFFSSKFCISSLIAILLRAEELYTENLNLNNTENSTMHKSWSEFLLSLSDALNRTIENQQICAAIETSAIAPMVAHLSRFGDLKLDPLLALFTQAKQQIK